MDGWDRGTCDLVAREYPLSVYQLDEKHERSQDGLFISSLCAHQSFHTIDSYLWKWPFYLWNCPFSRVKPFNYNLKWWKTRKPIFNKQCKKLGNSHLLQKLVKVNIMLKSFIGRTNSIHSNISYMSRRVVCEAIENIGVNDGGGNHCQAMWAMLWGNAPPPKNVIPPRTPDWMAFLPAQGQ